MSTKQTSPQAHSIANPETLYDPIPNGYSHLATVTPDSTLVFVAGQGGEDSAGTLVPDFRKQVRQAFENLKTALESEQAGMQNIVKLTTLVVDYNATKHQVLVEESARFWPDKKFPPQTLIPVSQLALEDMLFEIDAVAAI